MERKPRKHPEDDMQRDFFTWAKLAEARIPQLRWMFHVPNGGRRNAREGARLKGMGVKAGVWDVLFPYPSIMHGCLFYGLAIEFKAGKNKLTKEQLAFIDFLRGSKWMDVVCNSWHEARVIVCQYLEVKP